MQSFQFCMPFFLFSFWSMVILRFHIFCFCVSCLAILDLFCRFCYLKKARKATYIICFIIRLIECETTNNSISTSNRVNKTIKFHVIWLKDITLQKEESISVIGRSDRKDFFLRFLSRSQRSRILKNYIHFFSWIDNRIEQSTQCQFISYLQYHLCSVYIKNRLF